LTYHAFEDKEYAPDWRVEAIGADGEVYVTMFAGPDSERRAQEYAEERNELMATNKAIAEAKQILREEAQTLGAELRSELRQLGEKIGMLLERMDYALEQHEVAHHIPTEQGKN
jgi:transcriptional accessory protein Tex/SPT6